MSCRNLILLIPFVFSVATAMELSVDVTKCLHKERKLVREKQLEVLRQLVQDTLAKESAINDSKKNEDKMESEYQGCMICLLGI